MIIVWGYYCKDIEMLSVSDRAIFDLVRKVNALAEYLGLEFGTEPAKEEKIVVKKKKVDK